MLKEEEKKEIVATVVSLATKVMFRQHFYKFAGNVYHQQEGGPIGLRGTCAIARVVMQLFDVRWKNKLSKAGLTVWLIARYMDDIRCLLPPIRAGWRWVAGGMQYCKKWELEDTKLSSTEVTRRALGASMNEVTQYLSFTTEVGEEFEGGWLPTLDTSLKVTENNKVAFKFFEKETTSNRTVQANTAMGENAKIKIVSNAKRVRTFELSNII